MIYGFTSITETRPNPWNSISTRPLAGTRWTSGINATSTKRIIGTFGDPLNEVWRPTSVPCNHLPSNTWVHLIWSVERVGNQVHYISVSVADQVYDVDTYYTAQPNWYQEEIDIAFQMDGNYAQQPVQRVA